MHQKITNITITTLTWKMNGIERTEEITRWQQPTDDILLFQTLDENWHSIRLEHLKSIS